MFTYPMFIFLGMYFFIRNTAVYVVFAPQTYNFSVSNPFLTGDRDQHP